MNRFGALLDGGAYVECVPPRRLGSEYFVQHSPVITCLTNANSDARLLSGPLDAVYALKYSIKPQAELETLADICLAASSRIEAYERARPELFGSHEAASNRINVFLRAMTRAQMGSMQAAWILLNPKRKLPFYRSSHLAIDLKLSQAMRILNNGSWTHAVGGAADRHLDDAAITVVAGIECYQRRSSLLRAVSWFQYVEAWSLVKFDWIRAGYDDHAISSNDAEPSIVRLQSFMIDHPLDCDSPG